MPRTLEDFANEPLLPIAKAVEEVTGSRPHPATCSRWVSKGAGGIVLPSLLLGQRRVTTASAVRAWIVERTQASLAS